MQESGLVKTVIYPKRQSGTRPGLGVTGSLEEQLLQRGLHVWENSDLGTPSNAHKEDIIEELDADTVVDVSLLREGRLAGLEYQFSLLVQAFAEWLDRSEQRSEVRDAFGCSGSSERTVLTGARRY